MNDSSSGFKKAVRLLFGCILLFLAVSFGMIGAVVSFFLCTLFLSHITLLSVIALLVCFLISFSLSRIAWQKMLRVRHAFLALGAGLAAVIGVMLISSLRIFKSLVRSSEIIQPEAPETVEYWDLESGSRIAYLRFKDKLRSLTLPALILKAECDYLKWEVAYQYKSLLKNSTLLFL